MPKNSNNVLKKELAQTVRKISETAGYAWNKGWAERNAGNMSTDVTESVKKTAEGKNIFVPMDLTGTKLAGRAYLVTKTGSRYREIASAPEKNLVLVRITEKNDGYRILWSPLPGDRPTSEFISHLKVYDFIRRNNMPQKAVLHTHPTHIISLTHIEKYRSEAAINSLLFGMHPEVKVTLPEGVGFAPYCCPGTGELADATIKSLVEKRITVWEKHGVVAIGRDVTEAFDLVDTISKAAEIFFICKMAGMEPEGLNKAQLEELAELSKRLNK